MARRALEHLGRAREVYRRDDWGQFGRELDELEAALKRLSEQSE